VGRVSLGTQVVVVTRPSLITDGQVFDRTPSPLSNTFFCAQQFGSLVQQGLVTVFKLNHY
jgi:hypothetical protein